MAITKRASNPNPGEAKAVKPAIRLAAKPPTQAKGGLGLHNTPSDHAQKILRGSGRLTGPSDNFSAPGRGRE